MEVRLLSGALGKRCTAATYETMELAADEGLTMFAYTTEPGSKSEESLNLLASWAASPDASVRNQAPAES